MQIKILILAAFGLSACASLRPDDGSAPSRGIESLRSPSQIVTDSSPDDWQPLDPDYTLYLDVPDGQIVISLSTTLAKKHVAQIKTLASEGYYDGLRFYRVIEGFVAQAGALADDYPLGSGTDSLIAEFDEAIPSGLNFTPLGNDDGYAEQVGFIEGLPAGRSLSENRVWLAHCAGTVAFARSNERNSADATLYITLQPQRYLDRNLTVVGRVVWGMEYVQAIHRAPPESSGILSDSTRQTPIKSMRVAVDLPVSKRINLEVMDTNADIFVELIESRRNRPGDFFYFRPDYVDLCQMQIPVRSR